MSGYKKTEDYYAEVQDTDLPPAVHERNDMNWAMPPKPTDKPRKAPEPKKVDDY